MSMMDGPDVMPEPTDQAGLLAHLQGEDHAMQGSGMGGFSYADLHQVHLGAHLKEANDHMHPEMDLDGHSNDDNINSASDAGQVFRALGPAAGAIELRDVGDGPPVLSVRFPFNEWAEIDSISEGHFLERFAPGSLDESFARETPKMLFNHGMDPTMGKQVLAAPVTTRSDDKFAWLEAPMLDGVPPLLASGLRNNVYGASISFHVEPSGQEVVRAKPSEHNPKGLKERTITKAGIREGGPVTWGAYVGAAAAVRSVTDEFRPHDRNAEIAEMAREHPKELAALIQSALQGSEPEPPQPKKAPTPPRFRSREEYLEWLLTQQS